MSNIINVVIYAIGVFLYGISFQTKSTNKYVSYVLISYFSISWIGLLLRHIISNTITFDYILLFLTLIILSFAISHFKYHQEKEPDVEMTLADFSYGTLVAVTIVMYIAFLLKTFFVHFFFLLWH